MALQRNPRTEANGSDLFSLAERLIGETPSGEERSFLRSVQAPSLDLSESEEDYLVQLEAPGLDPDDLDVTISGRTLTIHGEKTQEEEEDDRDYHRVERRFGSFTRQINLPEEAEAENINAEYDRGILNITIPKSPESRTRTIDVDINES